MGAEGKLHAFDLASGKLLWKRDLRADYKVRQDFFGIASTPLVEGRVLIVNVGAPGGPCVVAMDTATGKEVWRAGNAVGAELRVADTGRRARPAACVRLRRRRVRSTHGRPHVDEPRDGQGGLLVPVAEPQLRVGQRLLPGGVRQQGVHLGELPHRRRAAADQSRLSHKVLWTTQEFALHWNTPIHRDGYLYGFDGRNEPDASLACVDVATGKVVWREIPEWSETVGGRPVTVGTYRGRCSRLTEATCAWASSDTSYGWI